jgi:hypothetical protein
LHFGRAPRHVRLIGQADPDAGNLCGDPAGHQDRPPVKTPGRAGRPGVRLVRPRREPRTDLQVWGPRMPAEGRSASGWADIRLSSMTIGVCIGSIAFGDASGERWQRVSGASKCLVLQCHLVAVRNRPLKHARRVANSVGFVHEVARPSAGPAVPIGPVSGSRSLAVGHARRCCDRCGSIDRPFGAEVALRAWGPAPTPDGHC